MPKAGAYLKCPCCGRAAMRGAFTLGALGNVPLQFLEHRLVGKGVGTKKTGERGGGVIWDRRRMSRAEAEHVFHAVTTAKAALSRHLDSDVPDTMPPERMLSQVDDLEELERIGQDWLAEAEEELERRRQLLQDELERRALAEEK